ncbi:MAG: AI-2E family transporter [bacterium]
MLREEKISIVFIKTLAVIVACGFGYLIWQLSDLIVLIIAALVIAATFNPLVLWLESKKISRKIASAGILIGLIVPVILIIALIIPVFMGQIDNIAHSITDIINSYKLFPKLLSNFDISQYTRDASQYLLLSTQALTKFVTEIIILLFMVYYLLIDTDSLYKLIALFISKKNKKKSDLVFNELATISGQYIRGNIFISIICTAVIFTGLLLLQVPGALALALFAGITDLLPLIGATMGAIPAVIIAFSVSPLSGVLTIVLFWVYQEVENDYLIPRVYSRALKIIPFLSFISVIIGTLLFGIAGAFLALPIAASIPAVASFYFDIYSTNKIKVRP